MAEPVPVFPGTVSNPYPSYTHCVQPGDYNSQSQYLQAFLAALLAGGVAAAIVAALGPDFWCYTLATLLGAIAGGLAYCNWWLNDRLICLPVDTNPNDPNYLAPIKNGPAVDVCAVGMYMTPPEGNQSDWTVLPFGVGDLDTDWTMDLVLYGTQPTQPTIDVLITETTAIQSLNLQFANQGDGQSANFTIPNVYDDGNSSQYANGGATVTSPVLHCEVEGGGVQDFQNWLQALFWATVASLIAQEALAAAGLPLVSIAVSEFMAFLILLLSLIGFYASEGDRASQGQANAPGQGSIDFQGPGSMTGLGATIVCVVGRWVYDSAHDGWNEIHPLKSVQAIGTMTPGPYYFPWNPSWAQQCGMISAAMGLTTQRNQQLPANGWIIHPLVDGCAAYPTEPPAPTTQ
jgi:hypothetical protein